MEEYKKLLEEARKYGDIIIGLSTDAAVAEYKRLPYLNYKQREIIIKNIRFVDKVIPQKTLDYTENLNLIKPNYVVHGDDWKTGIQKITRKKVINILKKYFFSSSMILAQNI